MSKNNVCRDKKADKDMYKEKNRKQKMQNKSKERHTRGCVKKEGTQDTGQIKLLTIGAIVTRLFHHTYK